MDHAICCTLICVSLDLVFALNSSWFNQSKLSKLQMTNLNWLYVDLYCVLPGHDCYFVDSLFPGVSNQNLWHLLKCREWDDEAWDKTVSALSLKRPVSFLMHIYLFSLSDEPIAVLLMLLVESKMTSSVWDAPFSAVTCRTGMLETLKTLKHGLPAAPQSKMVGLFSTELITINAFKGCLSAL